MEIYDIKDENNEWEQLKVGNLPEELTKNYDVKSIKIGDNEKIFYRRRQNE